MKSAAYGVRRILFPGMTIYTIKDAGSPAAVLGERTDVCSGNGFPDTL